MKAQVFSSIFIICAILSGSIAAKENTPISLMPWPRSVVFQDGYFRFDQSVKIRYTPDTEEMKQLAEYLSARIEAQTGLKLACQPSGSTMAAKDIHLVVKAVDGKQEAYTLTIAKKHFLLQSSTGRGLFCGLQTVQQLLAAQARPGKKIKSVQLPGVIIQDEPQFGWRGIMVDAGRHFIGKEYIKRLIDVMAYYKINKLHWHLTEDQGWRIEIVKYPLLTSVGAWRTEPDGTRYGGFYTQDDIREVVAYAALHHIDVVPEIELPGHCMSALAAHPELSCTGGPFQVQTQWGVFKDVYCAGKDSTFTFLEHVLDEVIALFPYGYVHVGGDEVPKDRWQMCPDCQKRMRDEGLKDEAELQSYFIQRIERFLRSRNRRLIGWDEILEGGLAAGATVQSWRGMEGALAAARSRHDAIASPHSHTYFNADIGDIDLRKAYAYQPIPAELEPEFRHHIIGGECCLWSERITEANLTRQLFPRLMALSEVLWTWPEDRDYDSFLQRARGQYQYLQERGVPYGPEARPVTILSAFDASNRQHRVTLQSGEPGLALHYTLDGTQPTLTSPAFSQPVVIDQSCTLKAAAFRGMYQYGEIAERSYLYHPALGKPVLLKFAYSPRYTGGGASGLADGLFGSLSFTDGCWQGFEGDDFIATVDLGQEMPLQMLSCDFLQNTGSWIFLPTNVSYAVSVDGIDYQVVANFSHPTPPGTSDMKIQKDEAKLSGESARFIRIEAENTGICPDWHPGAGGKAWIFVDEIVAH